MFHTHISTAPLKTSARNTFFKKLGFIPCKVEKPLRGMELQEKEAQKG